MSEKEKKVLAYNKAEVVAISLLQQSGIYFDRPTIWELLVEYFKKYDTPTDVLYQELTGEKIFAIVSEVYERNGRPVVVIDVSAPEHLRTSPDGKIEKANIRLNGTCWVIHKNDKDTFPSDPHAHDYDNNLKLDLGSGMMYRGKDSYKMMSRKDLTDLRYAITKRLPDLALPAFVR